eukprot:TRINITY_DN31476_c0_g1_i2.p1 TRINITY_DN31476_c0_g1~~TRINITY_DN31476_c0_g1_i2.p1  ORF type:complete len:110 (-),score=24.46 TRINITY_DN31476_c0_g1_i2:52-381(-)
MFVKMSMAIQYLHAEFLREFLLSNSHLASYIMVGFAGWHLFLSMLAFALRRNLPKTLKEEWLSNKVFKDEDTEHLLVDHAFTPKTDAVRQKLNEKYGGMFDKPRPQQSV